MLQVGQDTGEELAEMVGVVAYGDSIGDGMV